MEFLTRSIFFFASVSAERKIEISLTGVRVRRFIKIDVHHDQCDYDLSTDYLVWHIFWVFPPFSSIGKAKASEYAGNFLGAEGIFRSKTTKGMKFKKFLVSIKRSGSRTGKWKKGKLSYRSKICIEWRHKSVDKRNWIMGFFIEITEFIASSHESESSFRIQ